MKKTWVIFKKEMLDVIRDRRTIIMMVIFPLLFMPLVLNLTTSLTRSQTDKAKAKVLQVAVVANGNAQTFIQELEKRTDMVIKENIPKEKIEELVKSKTLDFGLVFEEKFDEKVAQKQSGRIEWYFKSSSEAEITKKRLQELLDQYKKELMDSRLKEMALEPSFIEPFTLEELDMATVKEKFGEYIGGFLPYIFILFCFLGGMYPAIDLAAGEKERLTIETLLSSPAKRIQIVVGKFLVITLAGLVSALLSIASLLIAANSIKGIPKSILTVVYRILELDSVLLTLSLLLPLCVFFAAAQLSVSLFAKSFKEAQSMMTPLNFLVIIPVIIGTIPGIKLDVTTALIPVLNVSLATKDIISGTIKAPLLMEVYLVMFLLSAAALILCTRFFKREDVIFRGI